MRTLLLLISLSLIHVSAFAQIFDQRQPPPNLPAFGSFTNAGLQRGAPWDTLDIYYDFRSERVSVDVSPGKAQLGVHHRERIILNEVPFPSFPLVRFPVYFLNEIEKLINFKAILHKKDGSTVFFDTTSIRTINVNDRYNLLEFVIEEAENGSVVDLDYKVERQYVEEIPEFLLASRFAAREVRFKIENSPFLVYETIPKVEPIRVNHVSKNVDTANFARRFNVTTPYLIATEWFWAYNIPALPNEAWSADPKEWSPRIKFLWKEFGNPRQPLEQSWEFVAAEMDKRYDIFKSLKAFQRDIGDFIQPSVSATATSKQIREAFLINNEHGFRTDTTLTDSTAINIATANLMLVAALRNSGREAFPALAASAQQAQLSTEIPSLMAFSELVVALKTEDGRWNFLDASQPDARPRRDLCGQDVMILNKFDFDWGYIPDSLSALEVKVDFKGELSSDGRIRGNLSENVGDLWQEYMSSHVQPTLLTEEGEMEIEGTTISFSDGLDLLALPWFALFNHPLTDSVRLTPIRLPQLVNYELNLELDLPRKLQLKEGASQMEKTNDLGSVTFSIQQKQRKLFIHFMVETRQLRVPVDRYDDVKTIYEAWSELSNKRWRLAWK